MSLFTNTFLSSVQENPVKRTIEACDFALSKLSDSNTFSEDDYNILIEVYAFLLELQETEILLIEVPFIELSGLKNIDSREIYTLIQNIRKRCVTESAKIHLSSFRSHFRTSFGAAFHYEFSQGDLERIQVLVNQLRQLLSDSKYFDTEHKQRLLKRLETLQSELHKKMSDLDRFWGLIGDAGVVLGKLGNDAKPFVDRIKEIADIVWRTQSRAEELPSGTRPPLLGDKNDDIDTQA